MKRTSTGPQTVVSLASARRMRRVELAAAQVEERLATQRRRFDALYQGGGLFSPEGTCEGRALLGAGKLLQRARHLVEELSGDGPIPAPRLPERIEATHAEVHRLLARADTLMQREAAQVKELRGR